MVEEKPMEQNVMDEIMKKAEVLIEALPYIQRFNRKIIVVKYGGSAMVDDNLKRSVIADVVLLKLVGFKPIIVHGGGKEISKWVAKAGMEPKFINGLRVTDEATMEIAEMVLNRVNKSLVQMIQQLGVKGVGISGKDGGLLQVDKKYSNGEDIGFVGDIKKVDPKILYDLLEKDFLPIVAPIGMRFFSDAATAYLRIFYLLPMITILAYAAADYYADMVNNTDRVSRKLKYAVIMCVIIVMCGSLYDENPQNSG